MGILNRPLVASAILSLIVGWSETSKAQQGAAPNKGDRVTADVAGKKSSQVSNLGELTRKPREASSIAMLEIAGNRAVGARMSDDWNSKDTVSISFPNRTSQLGSLGTVVREQVVLASVVSAARWSSGSQTAQGHSRILAPAAKKTPAR